MTAEEFIKNKLYITQDGIESVHDSLNSTCEVMIQFTKYHVEQALKKASYLSQNGITTSENILNCYPLYNIK